MFDILFRNRTSPDLSHARGLVEQGAVLLDVRTEQEFAEAHVRGAVNIPVQSLAQRLHELPPKHAPIVVHCRSGMRSASAADLLRRAGWSNVVDIGAMPTW